MKLFSTSEVTKILNLPDSRIRTFVRAGFLAPARDETKSLQFTFQDLLFLKTAKSLLASRVPAKRIVRILSSLKRQLPDEQHLSSVKIYADGRRVVVWDGRARWQPDSGQFLFNFDARSVIAAVKLPPSKGAKKDLGADYWFKLGTELEATSAEEAQGAYRRALEIDPKITDAHLNLGKLCHEAGQLDEAERHYRAAARLASRAPLADRLRPTREAVECYKESLTRDPDFADAHYNLGLLLENLGNKTEAFTHLRAARKLYIGK